MEIETERINEVITLTDIPKLKIYTKRAIWGFSIFFSAIFGAVLLMQNLKDIGRKKEANIILLLSIIYTIISIYIVNIPKEPITSVTYLCNIAGGAVLSEYYFGKYFPSPDDYGKKKIWKPLIISILILIPFMLAMVYNINTNND
jgi:hypothetical protein